MSSSSTKRAPTDQEITVKFNTFKSELQSLAQKIGELEQDSDEYKLVVNTITPMAEDRKCFRLVGGVLVERTVGEVLPALKSNQEGIKGLLEKLVEQYKKKDSEFLAFQKEHRIQIGNGGGGARMPASSSSSSS
ncbi:MAG: Prefoldin [Piptocephalis tieghemiana]|nr:MAG: Prefoldin [Piptocephalis tieghemiana]